MSPHFLQALNAAKSTLVNNLPLLWLSKSRSKRILFHVQVLCSSIRSTMPLVVEGLCSSNFETLLSALLNHCSLLFQVLTFCSSTSKSSPLTCNLSSCMQAILAALTEKVFP